MIFGTLSDNNYGLSDCHSFAAIIREIKPLSVHLGTLQRTPRVEAYHAVPQPTVEKFAQRLRILVGGLVPTTTLVHG